MGQVYKSTSVSWSETKRPNRLVQDIYRTSHTHNWRKFSSGHFEKETYSTLPLSDCGTTGQL